MARITFKVGSDPKDVLSPVRTAYYGALTSIVREDMTAEGIDGRKTVAAPHAMAASGFERYGEVAGMPRNQHHR